MNVRSSMPVATSIQLATLYEQENSLLLVTISACDKIRARYSGYKGLQVVSKQNVTFCATQGCINP